MARIHGAVVALILVLTACGSTESNFRDDLDELGFSGETADCLIEELETRGLTVDDISDDAIADGAPPGAVEAFDACLNLMASDLIDGDDTAPSFTDDSDDSGDGETTGGANDSNDGDVMTRELTALEQEFVAGAMEQGVTEEAARCVLGELIERDIDLMELASAGVEDIPDDFLAALAACGEGLNEDGAFDPADFTGSAAANDYGDDPALDALWDACATGDGDACDELYFTSPTNSVYEDFGNTCGGVIPEGAFRCDGAI